MREFEGGATRDDDTGKYDFDGFESPLVRHAYAEYMHAHRTQSDGKLRDSDNWKKGMGLDVYMKSLCRHFFEANSLHNGYVLATRANTPPNDDIVQALLAVKFNVNGYLHEYLSLADSVLDLITDVDPMDNPMMQLDREDSVADWVEKYRAWCAKEQRKDVESRMEQPYDPPCHIDPPELQQDPFGGHSTEAERNCPHTALEAYEREHMVDLQSRLQRILDVVDDGPLHIGDVLPRIHDIATGEDQLDEGGQDDPNQGGG